MLITLNFIDGDVAEAHHIIIISKGVSVLVGYNILYLMPVADSRNYTQACTQLTSRGIYEVELCITVVITSFYAAGSRLLVSLSMTAARLHPLQHLQK